jgi:FkbM family methyltransferase
MKAFLKSLPVVGPLLKKGRRGVTILSGPYHRWKRDAERNLHRILRGDRQVFIVQIGSNDGSTGDPIYNLLQRHPSWEALLVEPVPFLFERLRANHRGNARVRFDNVAVSEKAGTSSFYYIDAAAKKQIPDLPYWFDQLGSFDRAHITRHLGASIEPFIVSTELTTLPLAGLFERNRVTRIDVLHIDTEGHDWVILQQLDLAVWHPKVILFEHSHLKPADKTAALAFLSGKYRITDLGSDYLCVRL